MVEEGRIDDALELIDRGLDILGAEKVHIDKDTKSVTKKGSKTRGLFYLNPITAKDVPESEMEAPKVEVPASVEPLGSGRTLVTGVNVTKLKPGELFEGSGKLHSLPEQNSGLVIGIHFDNPEGGVFHFITYELLGDFKVFDEVHFIGKVNTITGNPEITTLSKSVLSAQVSEEGVEFDMDEDTLQNPPPSGDRKILSAPSLESMNVSLFWVYSNAIRKYNNNYAYMNEAIQNSARAKATRVDFEVHDDYLIVSDNGIGAEKDVLELVFKPGGSGWKSADIVSGKPFGEGLLSVLKIFDDIQILSKEYGFFMNWGKAKELNKKNPNKESVIPGEVYGFIQNPEGFTNGFKIICRNPSKDDEGEQIFDPTTCKSEITNFGRKWRRFYSPMDGETQETYDARYDSSGIFINNQQVQPWALKDYEFKSEVNVILENRSVIKGVVSIPKDDNNAGVNIFFSTVEQPYKPISYGRLAGYIVVKDEFGKNDELGLTPHIGRESFLQDKKYLRFVKAVTNAARESAYSLLGQIQAGIVDETQYSDFLKDLSVVDKIEPESDFGSSIYVKMSEVEKRMSFFVVPAQLLMKVSAYMKKQGLRTKGIMENFREMLNDPNSIIDETLKMNIIEFKHGLDYRQEEKRREGEVSGTPTGSERRLGEEVEQVSEEIQAIENQLSDLQEKFRGAEVRGDTSESERLKESITNLQESLMEKNSEKRIVEEKKKEVEDIIDEVEGGDSGTPASDKSRKTFDSFKKRKKVFYVLSEEIEVYQKMVEEAQYFGFDVLIATFAFQAEVFQKKGIQHIGQFSSSTKKKGSCKPIKSKKLGMAANRLAFLYQSIMTQLGFNLKVNVGILKFKVVTECGGEDTSKTAEEVAIEGFAKGGSNEVYLGEVCAQKAFAIFGVLNDFPQNLYQIGPGDVAALLANIEVFAHESAHAIYATSDNSKEHHEKIVEIQKKICEFLSRINRKSYLCKVERTDNDSIGLMAGKTLKGMGISDGDLSIITIEKGADLQKVNLLMPEGLKLESEEQE